MISNCFACWLINGQSNSKQQWQILWILSFFPVIIWCYSSSKLLAQLVERAPYVQRVCPRCSRPGFDSWPRSLCCLSLPNSLILFPVTSSAELSNKTIKGHKNALNKKTTNLMLMWEPPGALMAVDAEAALPGYPDQSWVGAGWWGWGQLVAT